MTTGKKDDYEWSESAVCFRHKKNRRFLSKKDAADLGLEYPVEHRTPPKPPKSPRAPGGRGRPPGSKNKPKDAVPVTESPAPTPPPPPVVAPAPVAPSAIKSDAEIFTAGSPPPPKIDAANPPPKDAAGNELPGGGTPPPPGATTAPAPEIKMDNRNLATMVWAMLVNIFVAIFGQEMQPRRMEIAPGKFHDENEMMISAWCDYLASLGLKAFSPLANLWLAFAAYFLPRLQIVIGAIKNRFRKKSSGEARGPKPPPTETENDTARPPSPAGSPPPPSPGQREEKPPASPAESTSPLTAQGSAAQEAIARLNG